MGAKEQSGRTWPSIFWARGTVLKYLCKNIRAPAIEKVRGHFSPLICFIFFLSFFFLLYIVRSTLQFILPDPRLMPALEISFLCDSSQRSTGTGSYVLTLRSLQKATQPLT